MKKLLFVFLFLITCSLPTSISANEPTVATRSEYRAFIDYTPIESYSIAGYTYIEAENLVNYGFNVFYDDTTKSINITRNKLAYPVYTKEMWKRESQPKGPADIIDSDIKVYLDGEEVKSYCIGNYNLIMIDELVKYGYFGWQDKDFYNKNQQKTVYIEIFKREMLELIDNAENVVEKEYTITTNHKDDANVKYIGQVNENGIPHGLGIMELDFEHDYFIMKYIGNFSNHKPDGLVYKETHITPSRTYTTRDVHFVGVIDGSKESQRIMGNREWFTEENFGISTFPISDVTFTFPEPVPDQNIYTEGCYFESWYGMYESGEYNTWVKDGIQTIDYRLFRDYHNPVLADAFIDKVRLKFPDATHSSDFSEHINNNLTFTNGSIRTLSIGNTILLNAPDAGAGFVPISISVKLNGEKLNVYHGPDPFMENGRVFVPIRDISDSLGCNVIWEKETRTVTIEKENKTITLKIDTPTMKVNDEEIELDTSPQIFSDITYVPVRAISEAFDAQVDWDDFTHEVTITTNIE